MCYQIRFDLKNKKRKYPSIVNLIMLTLVLSQHTIFFAIIRLSKDKEWYSMEVNFIGLSVSTQINSYFQWKLTSLMRSFFFYKEKERSVSTKMQVNFIDNVPFFFKDKSASMVCSCQQSCKLSSLIICPFIYKNKSTILVSPSPPKKRAVLYEITENILFC